MARVYQIGAPAAGGPLSSNVWTVDSPDVSAILPNGLTYSVLRHDGDDYVQFQFIAPVGGNLPLYLAYAAAGGAGGNARVRLDVGRFAVGSNPADALTLGTATTLAIPAAVTVQKLGPFPTTVAKGELVTLLFWRFGTDVLDTLASDIRVFGMGVA